MDEQTQASTTAFFTLDAFNGELALEVMNAIEEGKGGHGDLWKGLVEGNEALQSRLTEQGIEHPNDFNAISWDPATLLFTSCVELNNDGRPFPLGERLTRERFGRFPFEDGSALGYFRIHSPQQKHHRQRRAGHLRRIDGTIDSTRPRMRGTDARTYHVRRWIWWHAYSRIFIGDGQGTQITFGE